MVANQEYLEAEGAAGVVYYLDQARYEVGPQPAVLFIQNKEAAVNGLIQGGEGEHPQPNRKNVSYGPALSLHDVFGPAASLDVKTHRRAAPLVVAIYLESDRLIEHFLQAPG